MAVDSRAQGPDFPAGGPEYPRRVILRFRPEFRPKKDRLEPGDVPGWENLQRQFPSLAAPRRVVPSESNSAKAIEKLVRQAKERDPDYTPADIEQYYVVEVPKGLDADAPAAIAEALSRLTVVEQAYVESRPLPPPSTRRPPAAGSCTGNQLHLKPAPIGIDAEFAWTRPGGDGQLQGFVDIEWGWGMTNTAGGGQTVAHAALQSPGIPLFAGLNQGFEAHGTRALGVVAAQLLPNGVSGIAPNLARIACVGQWRPAEPGEPVDPVNDIAAAISVAAASMQRGDVLLLEAQGEFGGVVNVPVECEPHIRDVIALVTSAGIVVIEPAGNGDVNIDPLMPATDSGAIIVAAAEPGSMAKTTQSSYGSRVHCYAWGEQVVTTDYDLFNNVDAYTQPCGPNAAFNGTSSAAAIVAGAALAVQGMAQAGRGCRLAPAAVRTILSGLANGTAAVGTQIGVMPDLRRISTGVIDTAVLNTFQCA